jgi:proteic killer suppression protein
MELIFNDDGYDRLEVDASYSHGLPTAVVSLYRSRLQLLRAARDEHDLASMRCLALRPLNAPSRRHHSIRLNNQYCLIVELKKRPGDTFLQIVEVRIDETES